MFRSSLDSIRRELFSISDLIDPRYIPAVDISEIDGKAIMTIWVPTGIIEYLYLDKPRSPKQRICLSRREEK